MTADLETRPAANAALAIRPGQEMWTDRQKAALSALGIRGASNADMAVFMHYCQRTGLDPFSRQIYMLSRREKVGGDWVTKWTIQVGIDGFRVIRDRVAGRLRVEVEYEDTVWYDADGGEHKVWLQDGPPAACGMAVLKNGKRFPAVVRYSAYVPLKDGRPTGLWGRMDAEQIEKCAEAKALRRAFPNDLGGLYIEDEMPDAGEPVMSPVSVGRVTAAEVIPPAAADTEDAAGAAGSAASAPEGLLRLIGARLLALGVEDPSEVAGFAGVLAQVDDLESLAALTAEQAARVQEALKPVATREALIALVTDGEKPE